DFTIHDTRGIIQGGFQNRTSRPIAYEFVKSHYDAIVDKLPSQFRPYIAFIIAAMCDESKKPEFDSFFKPRIEKLAGGPRAIAPATEQLQVCAAAKKAETAGVDAFLKNQ